MSNQFYNHSTFPVTGSAATSQSMRAELDLIAAGFDKMPGLTGNNNKLVAINGTATGLTVISTSAQLAAAISDETGTGALVFGTGPTLTNPTITGGSYAPTTFTFPAGTGSTTEGVAMWDPSTDLLLIGTGSATKTLVDTNSSQVFINKTFNLANNTLVATSAQLAAAVSDETGTGSLVFATSPTLAGTPLAPTAVAGTNTTQIATTAYVFAERSNAFSLTNKTISGASNTLTNIGNSSLTNSSVTIGTTAIALGATSLTLAGLTSVAATTFTGALTGNASTATTLANTRTIWGQNFNGSANVSGALSGVTDIAASGSITLSSATANGVAYLNGSKVLTTGSALTFDGSKLGVGTSSPISKLHVTSETAIDTYATVGNISNGVMIGVSAAGVPVIGRYSGSGLAFGGDAGTSFTEQMRLTSTGLGIGTSSPGAKLDVNGNLFVRANNTLQLFNADNTNSFQLYNSGATGTGNANLIFTSSSAAVRMTLDSSGNLGLGVTPSAWRASTPAFQVGSSGVSLFSDSGVAAELGNNVFLNSSSQYIYQRTGLSSRYQQYQGIHKWFTAPSGTAGNAISFTQAMTLDASGNLGIGAGAATPAAMLHVAASQIAGITTAAIIGASGNGGAGRGVAISLRPGGLASSVEVAKICGLQEAGTPTATAAALTFQVADVSGTLAERMRIDSSGNLGLGVTPSAWGAGYKALDLNRGSLTAGSASVGVFNNAFNNGTNWLYTYTGAASYYQQSDAYHRWYTAPSGTAGNAISFTQAMTLDASGNLGIGTSSPVAFGAGYVNAQVNGTTGSFLNLSVNGTRTGYMYADVNGVELGSVANTFTRFMTANTERMRIDSAGNLGLGVTPSVNNGGTMLQVGPVSNLMGTSNTMYLQNNSTYNTGWKYITNGYATRYDQINGAHSWYTAPSGTAGNAISFTQAMTLDASGRLGIGTSSPTNWGAGWTSASVVGSTAGLIETKAGTVSNTMYSVAGSGIGYVGTQSAHPLAFLVNGSERMRIDSAGTVGVNIVPSAWATFSALQVNRTSISGSTTNGYFSSNLYYSGGFNYIAAGYGMVYSQENGEHKFGVSPSGTAGAAVSPTMVVRITNAGELLVGKSSATANGANLQTSDGITFPATQVALSDANTLDDYEEGNWTPTYSLSTAGTSAFTYVVQTGKYTKIGDTVHAWCIIRTNSFTVGTGSGTVRITGFPFTSNTTIGYCAGTISYSNGFAVNFPNGVMIPQNTTYADIYYKATLNGNSMALGVADLATGASANYIICSITYKV